MYLGSVSSYGFLRCCVWLCIYVSCVVIVMKDCLCIWAVLALMVSCVVVSGGVSMLVV